MLFSAGQRQQDVEPLVLEWEEGFWISFWTSSVYISFDIYTQGQPEAVLTGVGPFENSRNPATIHLVIPSEVEESAFTHLPSVQKQNPSLPLGTTGEVVFRKWTHYS